MTNLTTLFKVTTLSLTITLLAGCNDDDNDTAPAQRSNQTVNILAFNDFHGNLEPPKRYVEAPNPNDAAQSVRIPVGGVSYFADAIKNLKQKIQIMLWFRQAI